MGDRVRLITGNSHLSLARAIAKKVDDQLTDRESLTNARVERFKDSEVFVEIYDNMRGEDVFVIQSTSKPANDNLMELMIIIDALRRSSARRITAVIPYFGYARQDRKAAARTPISAKLVANLLTKAGADRILTMDLHAGQIQGFFDVPTDNLYATPLFALDAKLHHGGKELLVVSPDVGGVVRARDLAKRIGADLAIVDKRRPQPGVSEAMNVIGEVEGKCCLLIDDICDTAGTLCAAADAIKRHGAKEAHAYVSHGVLSSSARQRLQESSLASLVITDSIPQPECNDSDKIRQIPIAPLFAQAILGVARNASISFLFREQNLLPFYPQYAQTTASKADA